MQTREWWDHKPGCTNQCICLQPLAHCCCMALKSRDGMQEKSSLLSVTYYELLQNSCAEMLETEFLQRLPKRVFHIETRQNTERCLWQCPSNSLVCLSLSKEVEFKNQVYCKQYCILNLHFHSLAFNWWTTARCPFLRHKIVHWSFFFCLAATLYCSLHNFEIPLVIGGSKQISWSGLYVMEISQSSDE